jgi:hypothetical protein
MTNQQQPSKMILIRYEDFCMKGPDARDAMVCEAWDTDVAGETLRLKRIGPRME